mgnify:CR=1 FL=1
MLDDFENINHFAGNNSHEISIFCLFHFLISRLRQISSLQMQERVAKTYLVWDISNHYVYAKIAFLTGMIMAILIHIDHDVD